MKNAIDFILDSSFGTAPEYFGVQDLSFFALGTPE
jgi:hypothetical protein